MFPKEANTYSIDIDYFSLIWIIVSFMAMYRFKISMITWIGISALAGLGYYVWGLFM
jgi:chromate transporter